MRSCSVFLFLVLKVLVKLTPNETAITLLSVMPTLSRHTKAIAARALETHTTMGDPEGLVGRLCVSSHTISIPDPRGSWGIYLGSVL